MKAKEWIIERVEELTEPTVPDEADHRQDNRADHWTCRKRLYADAEKSDEVKLSDVRIALHSLADERKLLNWHGLITPATMEYLECVVQNEVATDSPRKYLVARCNRWMHQKESGGE